MLIQSSISLSDLRKKIAHAYLMDESTLIHSLIEYLSLDDKATQSIQKQASYLVKRIRESKTVLGLENFLHEFSLKSEEGVALMCIAEALLRIPDKNTIDRLIKDKIAVKEWTNLLGRKRSLTANATTWLLMLTGKVLQANSIVDYEHKIFSYIKKIISHLTDPVIRNGMTHAMHHLATQFVIAETIEEALSTSKPLTKLGYWFSYDMLGEGARTYEDAERYYQDYKHAIQVLGQHTSKIYQYGNPSISVKLSALHPRYELSQASLVLEELTTKLIELCKLAKANGIGLTIDAEEVARLDLSLDIIEILMKEQSLSNWLGLGVAVQAYQKRSWFVLDWLGKMAFENHRKIHVRLVKGAYWDSEIKRSQILGLNDYPVFITKSATDIAYMACVKKLLEYSNVCYPEFATHNAHSIATVLFFAKNHSFEFQRLYGMGQSLYDELLMSNSQLHCRIYAPVGYYKDLLPYLIRRILENGANTSFVHRVLDKDIPIEALIRDPIAKYQIHKEINKDTTILPLPRYIYPDRLNAKGLDLVQWEDVNELSTQFQEMDIEPFNAYSIVNGRNISTEPTAIYACMDKGLLLGNIYYANSSLQEEIFEHAEKAYRYWHQKNLLERAQLLIALADLLETHYEKLLYFLLLEAGKTIHDAIAEVREAIDFCRYYAESAKQQLQPQTLQGYTGELNILSYHGKGIFVCISPWNFPLSIFIGQIVAALVSGNAVIAKPAEQTNFVAFYVIQLCYQVGIPKDVLQLILGRGDDIGEWLLQDTRVAGVVFTGSTKVAQKIQLNLANRDAPLATVIAETGGINAMIVDSSALLEKVVDHIIVSAFGSAGQRCSSLRILYVQTDIYSSLIKMLIGAMATLKVGDPRRLNTDIGPIIDLEAKQKLMMHIEYMRNNGKILYQSHIDDACKDGVFVPPTLIELSHDSILQEEIFGPILHVCSYETKNLEQIIHSIKAKGYGLTLGIQSRIGSFIDKLTREVGIGNCYVNRSMTGAVVGVQPFGGEHRSGTGPKAGGPNYLKRLCFERVLTIDTTAFGGNVDLLTSIDL